MRYIIVYLLTLIALIVLYPDKYEVFNSTYILILSIIYGILVFYFFHSQRKRFKNWVRIDVFFILGYSIVHFQIPFLASIGIEPNKPEFVWINKMVVNYATWMSLFAITLWMLGYTFILNKSSKKYKPVITKNRVNYKKYDLILLVSFVIFLILAGSAIFKGTYDGGKSWGVGANYAFLVTSTLLYLRIIYYIKEVPRKNFFTNAHRKALSNKIFLLVLITFTFLFLFSGDRGPIYRIALVIAGSYSIFIKPIKFKQLTILILIGAFVFTIIGLGRSSNISKVDEGNIFTRGYTNYKEIKDEINITNELATSVRIQYRALDVVPDEHSFLFGITFLMQIVGVIPFFSGFVQKLLNIPDIYLSTSNFFTFIGQGAFATYGEGSEVLADIYVNFGEFGVYFIMLLFGMFVGTLTKRSNTNNLVYILMYLVLLYYALSINRGMLLSPLKHSAYILFFNYLFTKVIK